MNIEQLRNIALAMPFATERCPYGPDTLCFEVGGKQFCLVDLSNEWRFYNLKVDPDLSEDLREQYTSVRPGYHMNKRHWVSVDYQGDFDDAHQQQLIAHAYWQTARGFSGKKRQELRLPSHDVATYIEENIVPRYNTFDKAHRVDHVRAVMEATIRLLQHLPHLDADMAYAVAAFHDLGLINGRENHHRDSRLILEADEFINRRFNAQQIKLMGEAVEDHRASRGEKPRNEYGLVVAEADRQIDVETIIRRTVQYGLANYPELDAEGQRRRALEHLHKKYGPDGYLKVYLPFSDNAGRLRELHILLADEPNLSALLTRILAEESPA